MEHFWTKVNKTDGCWIWTAAKDHTGYGTFAVTRDGRKTTARAHRFAYELLVGEIPEGRELHHVCCVRLCVNPEHLQVVTRHEHPDAGPAVNRAKTHCPSGHEYTPENTFISSVGKRRRRCRECLRVQWRNREKRRTNASRGRDAAYWRAYRARRKVGA